MTQPVRRLIATDLFMPNEAVAFDFRGLEGSARELPALSALSFVTTPAMAGGEAMMVAEAAAWAELRRLRETKLSEYRLWRFSFVGRKSPDAAVGAPEAKVAVDEEDGLRSPSHGVELIAESLGSSWSPVPEAGALTTTGARLYLLSRRPDDQLAAADSLQGLCAAALARSRPRPPDSGEELDWRDLALLVCPLSDFVIRVEASAEFPRVALHLLMTKRMLASLLSPGPFRPEVPAEERGN